MRRQILTIMALAGVVMLAGCKKKQMDTIDSSVSTIIATIDDESGDGGDKTVLTPGGGILWMNDDALKVYGGGNTGVYTLSDGAYTNEGTFAKTSGTTPTGGAYTAAYPSSMVSSIGTNTVTFTLPATQTLAANSFGNGAAPMVAYSTNLDEFSFYNACGGICIPVRGIGSLKKIMVTATNNITGTYTVNSISTTPTTTFTGSGNTITLTADNAIVLSYTYPTYFYVMLPDGIAQQTYTISLYDEDDNVLNSASKTFSAISRNEIRFMDEVMTYVPEGYLLGVFSVSDDTKVRFSKGNLQYIGSAATPYWKFADNQYDYLGTTTSQNSSDTDKDRDLFGWATSGYSSATTSDNTWVNYQPWATSISVGTVSTSTNYYEYGPGTGNIAAGTSWNDDTHYSTWKVCDWGHNAISNGGNTADVWRTLTKDEWMYLFGMTSNNSDASGHARYRKYFRATVNSVQGIVVLPDDISGISNIPEESSRGTASTFGGKTYDIAAWTTLEASGCVFLPTAGRRDGTTVNDAGSRGLYWSSTASDANIAYYLTFNSSYVGPSGIINRYYGHSVRLVVELYV